MTSVNINEELHPRVVRRFSKYVKKTDGCWYWTASTNGGYGQIGIRLSDGKQHNIKAHRLSYRLHFGAVPVDRDLHHKCENKICVRPDHLEPVTELEHVADLSPTARGYINKRKTNCSKCGLPLSGENLLVYPNSRHPGWRRCRACKRNRYLAKRSAQNG